MHKEPVNIVANRDLKRAWANRPGGKHGVRAQRKNSDAEFYRERKKHICRVCGEKRQVQIIRLRYDFFECLSCGAQWDEYTGLAFHKK